MYFISHHPRKEPDRLKKRHFGISIFSWRLILLILVGSFCHDVSSQSEPPDELILPLQLKKGWNLCSLPAQPVIKNPEPFFQGHMIGSLWQWVNGQYQPATTIEGGVAYWVYLKQDIDTVYKIHPDPNQTLSQRTLNTGWNLIPVIAPITDAGPTSGVQWKFTDGRYRVVEDELLPGPAYWIYRESAGNIDLGSLTTDTDGDEIPDYWEALWEFDYNEPGDKESDPDSDKLMNVGEYRTGTHPRRADTDGDSLVDGDEVNLHKTSPHLSDSDNDTFGDALEVEEHTDPANRLSTPQTGITSSPANGERDVALTRETIIRLPKPISTVTIVDETAIVAEFAETALEARYQTSPDRRTITLFYKNPLPASARIRVTVHGDMLIDNDGLPIDADGDGISGGTVLIEFDTLTLTVLTDTESNAIVCGRVFDSEQVLAQDGVTRIDKPLAGVKVTVDGAEDTLFAITDACGNFRLDPAPVGKFFVHIDGRTATTPVPEDAYYPVVGKSWESIPGEEVNVGNVYLPLILSETLQDLDDMDDTPITFPDTVLEESPELAGTVLMVPPGSLVDEDGNEGGRLGIAPVPADRLPGALPEGLEGFPIVITVQSDTGTNFNEPVPVCFPNRADMNTGLPLEPREKTGLWSFNHDAGRWEVVGPMTVSEDGTQICTDPGIGILAPGWHCASPGTPCDDGPPDDCPGGPNCEPKPKPCTLNNPDECKECNDEKTDPTDPVYLFSGEFYDSFIDLKIKGRGMDFIWARRYRSQHGPNTAIGNGWDFSYNIFLVKDGRGIRVCNGEGRQDLYRPRPDGTYGFNGFFQTLAQNNDSDNFSITFPSRGQWDFHPFDESPKSGKLTRISDRNGNTISFEYDEKGQLATITDTLDRDITVQFNADGFLKSITDFIGRKIQYEYYDGMEDGGNLGDLKSVTTPAVTGTPNGNDFPNGKTTTYTYTTGFTDDQLNSNLLTITDGRRNDPNDSTFGDNPYLVNIYSDTTNPDDFQFNRVVRQIWGGDTVDITYMEIAPTIENGNAETRTIVNDRNGNVKEYFYDRGYRCTLHRDYTGRADPIQPTTNTDNRPTNKLRSEDPEFFETRFVYNNDYQRTRTIHPNGDITENIYEGDLNPQASARFRGNLRMVRHLPGDHRPIGDQDVIEESFEYDIDFGCGGGCGFNFVAKHTDGRGNETISEYDDVGNLILRQHRIDSIVEEFEYNQWGQMTAKVWPDNGDPDVDGDEHRRRDEYTYYEDGHQRGYLKDDIVDVGTANFNLSTTYEYDAVGNVVSRMDPRRHDTQYIVNELDQVVREISREVIADSELRYQKDFFYDANNNLVRTDIINIDDQGVLQENTHFTKTYEYEILNFMTKKSEEIDPDHFIVEEYEYDGNRNRIETRMGEATNGNQLTNTLHTEYDERDLVYRIIRAKDPPDDSSSQVDSDQSTAQFDYDPNKNQIRRSLGIEDTPRIFTTLYDSYNRAVLITDPMGNIMNYSYDANHNNMAELSEGELTDVKGSVDNIRLAKIAYTYDPMDRIKETSHEFFDTETQEAISDGKAITQTFWNDNSQVIKVVDDNGHHQLRSYDTANRVLTQTDNKTNSVTYEYDENSNVIKLTEIDKSDLGNPDETFISTNEYDGLDRLIRSVDPLQHTTDTAYDSRNNQTVSIDALGNMVRHTYDGINRLTQTTRFLTDSGSGIYNEGENNVDPMNVGGATRRRLAFNQPSNTINTIITKQTWDDTSRLTSQIDDNGNATTYVYDALNRKIKDIYADGTEHIFAYDVHDNKISTTDANSNMSLCTYDLLNRLIEKDITPGAGVSDATTFEIFKYDGLSRLIHAEDDDSLVIRKYDSLSRVTTEVLNGQTTRCVYDGVGNQIQCIYPGGRTVLCTYDELDRKKEISDQNGLIATYFYIGPSRVERRDYGNNTNLTIEYDVDRRITRTNHEFQPDGPAIPVTIDDRTYTWDDMDNKIQRKDVRSDGPQLTHDYTYDSIYRLVNTDVNDPNTEIRATDYQLDGVGNRTSVTENQLSGTYNLSDTTPEPADFQLNQYTSTPSDTREYDLNGNLTVINRQPSTVNWQPSTDL